MCYATYDYNKDIISFRDLAEGADSKAAAGDQNVVEATYNT